MISNNVAELIIKVGNVHDYKTRKYVLYIRPGTYKIAGPLDIGNGAKNVVIRGLTGNPADVQIWGNGFNNTNGISPLIAVANASNITLAHITLRSASKNCLKFLGGTGVENILVYNCHFRDVGQRMIKGTETGGDGIGTTEIKYCYFKNDTVHPPGFDDGFNGNYTGGIDCAVVSNWNIHHNLFEGIRGSTGGGRGGVFIWKESRNVTTQCNIFMNCDRSVAYGNSADASGYGFSFHMDVGLALNNFIVGGVGNDIEFIETRNGKIYNNTIYDRGGGRAVYYEDCSSINQYNNIIIGNTRVNGGQSPTSSNNITSASSSWFVNYNTGDLHIRSSYSGQVVDGGRSLSEATTDIDGCSRHGNPDIGADEYNYDNCGTISMQPGTGNTEYSDRSIVSVYPNPFRRALFISLLKNSNIKMQSAKFVIFNSSGRKIRATSDVQRATYIWDGRDNSGSFVPCGNYIIRVKTGGLDMTRSVTLVK
jgi:hypothetical protein